MEWLKTLFTQFKSKTVWGVLILMLVSITGLDSETLTGILDKVIIIVQAIGYILTAVGINHKLEKWLEVLKKKPE